MILVTRPGEPGQQLAARLGMLGHAALWWPAFDLLPPSDPHRVQASVDHLAQFDLVVFVSPMAVRAFAPALGARAWPGTARIAAVGATTLRAAREQLRPGAAVPLYGPDGPDGGAEALWPILERLAAAPRRVLIVRAQTGREWLGQRLRAAGAAVEEIEAYRRVAHEPAAADWTRLRIALDGNGAAPRPLAPAARLAVLFSSSEAVGVVTAALQRAQVAALLPDAVSLCVHERIVQAARSAGWRDVRRCDPEVESVLAALAGDAPAADPSRSRAAAG